MARKVVLQCLHRVAAGGRVRTVQRADGPGRRQRLGNQLELLGDGHLGRDAPAVALEQACFLGIGDHAVNQFHPAGQLVVQPCRRGGSDRDDRVRRGDIGSDPVLGQFLHQHAADFAIGAGQPLAKRLFRLLVWLGVEGFDDHHVGQRRRAKESRQKNQQAQHSRAQMP